MWNVRFQLIRRFFFSFFNILFARVCVYFATSCEGSKKFPHLWINVFHLHNGEEMEDTVKTDLIYAVRVKMGNWYSTCRPVVMERDQRICRCTCQVTQYFQDWKIVYFPLFINESNSTIFLHPQGENSLPIQNRCLLSYGLDTFYISLYHIWWIILFGIWDIGHHL